MILLRASLGVLFAAAMFSSRAEASMCTLGNPVVTTPITSGVTYVGYGVSCPKLQGNLAVVPTAQQSNLHVVTIDLTTPNLTVKASQSVVAPSWLKGTGAAYQLAPVTAVFSSETPPPGGMPVPRVAINANLFTNCCTVTAPPAGDGLTLARGLEVAPGSTATTPPLTNLGQAGFIPYATFASSLLVDASNHASVWTAAPGDTAPAGIVTAVTGSHQIVALGSNTVAACSDDYPCLKGAWSGPNARTGVGLKGPSTLLMIVFDGIDNSQGVSLNQFGDIVAQLADTAINLDGGGSSTLVGQVPGKGVTILNDLAGANPRYVGVTLWVEAP